VKNLTHKIHKHVLIDDKAQAEAPISLKDTYDLSKIKPKMTTTSESWIS
jgi:hypothetical protein